MNCYCKGEEEWKKRRKEKEKEEEEDGGVMSWMKSLLVLPLERLVKVQYVGVFQR